MFWSKPVSRRLMRQARLSTRTSTKPSHNRKRPKCRKARSCSNCEKAINCGTAFCAPPAWWSPKSLLQTDHRSTEKKNLQKVTKKKKNHRWTQMNTDGKQRARRTAQHRTRSRLYPLFPSVELFFQIFFPSLPL